MIEPRKLQAAGYLQRATADTEAFRRAVAQVAKMWCPKCHHDLVLEQWTRYTPLEQCQNIIECPHCGHRGNLSDVITGNGAYNLSEYM